MNVMRSDEMKPNYLADGPNRRSRSLICAWRWRCRLGQQVFARQSRAALRDRPDQQAHTLAAFQAVRHWC